MTLKEFQNWFRSAFDSASIFTLDPQDHQSILIFLIILIPSLLIGFSLCLLGLKFIKFTCLFAFAGALGFLAHTLTINLVTKHGIIPNHHNQPNLIILMVIIMGSTLIGFIITLILATLLNSWTLILNLGSILLSTIETSMVIITLIEIFSNNHLAQSHLSLPWIFIGILTAGFLTLRLIKSQINLNLVLLAFSSSTLGTFLIFLSIDILVNHNKGFSLGWRRLYDHNPLHAPVLAPNHHPPPTSTRVFVGLCWLLTPLFTAFQLVILPPPCPSSPQSILIRSFSPNTEQIIVKHEEEGVEGKSNNLQTATSLKYHSQYHPLPSPSTPTNTSLPPIQNQQQPSDTTTTTIINNSAIDLGDTLSSLNLTGLSAIPELSERSRSESIGRRGAVRTSSAKRRSAGSGAFASASILLGRSSRSGSGSGFGIGPQPNSSSPRQSIAPAATGIIKNNSNNSNSLNNTTSLWSSSNDNSHRHPSTASRVANSFTRPSTASGSVGQVQRTHTSSNASSDPEHQHQQQQQQQPRRLVGEQQPIVVEEQTEIVSCEGELLEFVDAVYESQRSCSSLPPPYYHEEAGQEFLGIITTGAMHEEVNIDVEEAQHPQQQPEEVVAVKQEEAILNSNSDQNRELVEEELVNLHHHHHHQNVAFDDDDDDELEEEENKNSCPLPTNQVNIRSDAEEGEEEEAVEEERLLEDDLKIWKPSIKEEEEKGEESEEDNEGQVNQRHYQEEQERG